MTNSTTNISKIILALDVPTAPEAYAWIDRLPQVEFWKVGLELFISAGPEVLKFLNDRGKKIFLDLKLHDIPHTVANACKVAQGYGIDLLTVHGSGGKAMLKAAQEAISHPRTQLLAVTVLTSLSDRELSTELCVNLSLEAYVTHLALMSQELGLGGIVCSPQEVNLLKPLLDRNFLLVTPGIRLQGDQRGDQQRLTPPRAAFLAGATYIVVGRSVLQSANPLQAWEELCAEVG